jgi:hypothetical protein
VPDLLDCQADEKSTLIAGLAVAIEHPHDCLGVCGCGDGSGSLLLPGKELCDFLMSITTRNYFAVQRHWPESENRRETAYLSLDALDTQSTPGS